MNLEKTLNDSYAPDKKIINIKLPKSYFMTKAGQVYCSAKTPLTDELAIIAFAYPSSI